VITYSFIGYRCRRDRVFLMTYWIVRFYLTELLRRRACYPMSSAAGGHDCHDGPIDNDGFGSATKRLCVNWFLKFSCSYRWLEFCLAVQSCLFGLGLPCCAELVMLCIICLAATFTAAGPMSEHELVFCCVFC
jgi:hypothetical protein